MKKANRKLLLITQAVDRNDPVLGFFHRWIVEFAVHCEQITVVCLRQGEYSLPENVRVFSLGKEKGGNRLFYLWRFYKYLWRERKNYQGVFVHMNHIYVVLGTWLWQLLGKRTVLWYAHGHVPPLLPLAAALANQVVTSTQSGFRLESHKTRIVGQGIDTEQFAYCYKTPSSEDVFRLISIGRVSPIKKYETLIEAVNLLNQRGFKTEVTIIGGAGLDSQRGYYQSLVNLVQQRGLSEQFKFLEAMPNHKIKEYLCRAHLFVNPSQTGSLDKSGLEAMAVGLPIVTCNEAYDEEFGDAKELLKFAAGDAVNLSQKILAIQKYENIVSLSENLRHRVVSRHSVQALMPKILESF